MLNGFNPQPFTTTNMSDDVEDDYFEEEEKSRLPKCYFTFNGNHSEVRHIMSYEPYYEQ